jgi:hypothetical protein
MDGDRFDNLIKRLGASRLTRLSALRGLTAAAVAAAGASLVVDEGEAKKRRKDENKNKNKNRKRKRKEKTQRICHCDANGNNCRTQKLSKKKAKRRLRQNPNDFKGRCDNQECSDPDTACNLNRPYECCSGNCCLDLTSGSNGICAPAGGRCCGQHAAGGYCTSEFSQCCAQNACCRPSETCCANTFNPLGYCCPPGMVCDANQPNGCGFVLQVQIASQDVAPDHDNPGRIRVRAGS